MRYAIPPLVLSAALHAQIPDGALVACSFDPGPATAISGPGGLFVADAWVPGPLTALTGLGTDLTGPDPLGPMGARSVAIRQDDGALLVGEIAPAGHTVDLHEIRVIGGTVVSNLVRTVGVAAPGGAGAIPQVSVLPSGDALVCVSGLMPTAPLFGATIAIVTRGGAVQPLSVAGSTVVTVTAVTADPSGAVGYAAISSGGAGTEIHSFALPGGGATSLIASIDGVRALAVDSDGMLLATSSWAAGEIVRVDPGSGAVSSVAWVGPMPSAVQFDRASGRILYGLDGVGPSGAELGWIDQGGGTNVLSAAITGSLSGIDVYGNPRIYGAPTPGDVEQRWVLDPSAGGVPRLGDSSFTLRMTSTASTVVSTLIASPRPSQWSYMGVEVLLDPTWLIPFGEVSSTGVVPLPIPIQSTLGMSLCFQGFYLDAGAPAGVGASDGIRVTVMP